jgi:hypothetical protein
MFFIYFEKSFRNQFNLVHFFNYVQVKECFIVLQVRDGLNSFRAEQTVFN